MPIIVLPKKSHNSKIAFYSSGHDQGFRVLEADIGHLLSLFIWKKEESEAPAKMDFFAVKDTRR